jgi:hypothetical protein
MALDNASIRRGDNNERDKTGQLRDKSGQLRDKTGQDRDKNGTKQDTLHPSSVPAGSTLRSVKTSFFPGFSGVAPIRWPELDQPDVGYKRQKTGKGFRVSHFLCSPSSWQASIRSWKDAPAMIAAKPYDTITRGERVGGRFPSCHKGHKVHRAKQAGGAAPLAVMNDPRSCLGWPDLARFLPSLYRPWMFHPKNRKHTFSR